MTKVEWKLWSRLSRRQLAGFKFRRQAPIGPYVVDFYCPALRLVIEVDGPHHDETVLQDAERDRWLKIRGYRVLRLSADEVYDETDDVAEASPRQWGGVRGADGGGRSYFEEEPSLIAACAAASRATGTR